MKIVLAPDSFKGSLTAAQVCAALEAGIRIEAPGAEVLCVPMADGGEGTVQSLIDGLGGRFVTCKAEDPLGRCREAVYGLTDNGTAVIEMAQASGLLLLKDEERNPLITSTYGTGQLIKDALDRGARKFIIGIGGSATNDGGVGMAQALGYRFLDLSGDELSHGGGALADIERIDASYADARLNESIFTVACDVDNPLTGPRGASRVFGPQKGATPEMALALDRALGRLAERIAGDLGIDVADIPGAGAAGGLGAGGVAFLGAELKKGVDIVIDATGLKDKINGADLVITGEGRTDSQTLGGKTIFGVAELAESLDVPAIVISGSLADGADELLEHGVILLYAIMEDGITLKEAMRDGAELLAGKSAQALRDFTRQRERQI